MRAPADRISTRLLPQYLGQLRERLAALEPIAGRLERGAPRLLDYETMEREAHRLAGTGATYGFPDITDTGFALELALRNGVRDSGEIGSLLASLLTAVARALEEYADEAKLDVTAAAEPPVSRQAWRPSVLFGDDDLAVQQAFVRAIGAIAAVTCCDSGQAILQAVQAQRFDLVVLDFELSDMNGLEVLEALAPTGGRNQPPVMMLTARRDVALVKRFVAAGVRDYILKPFEPSVIFERVQAILERLKPVILVADDDPLIREIFRNKLVQRGCDVHVASSGLQALEMAGDLRPHAIILDRSMPRMDGLDVLASIRRDPKLAATPILILSAHRSKADVDLGYEHGADDYICKPFLPENVAERCVRLVRRRRSAA